MLPTPCLLGQPNPMAVRAGLDMVPAPLISFIFCRISAKSSVLFSLWRRDVSEGFQSVELNNSLTFGAKGGLQARLPPMV